MHITNPIFALSSVSVENGEGPSVPKTCQVAGASVPLQEPVKDVEAPITRTPVIDIPAPRLPSPTRDVSMRILQTSARGVSDQIFQPSSRDALPPSSPTLARDVAVLNSRTTVEDVPISQVPANDTPGTKIFVDVHISKPRLKPPDPNACEVAPKLSARPIQEIQ